MRPNVSLVLMWKPSHYNYPYWKKIYIHFKVDVTINVPRSAMASRSISFQGLGTVSEVLVPVLYLPKYSWQMFIDINMVELVPAHHSINSVSTGPGPINS